MRHLKAGNRLGVTTAHRRAMMRNMVTSILEFGQITCTLARAKEVRKPLEKMIGWGKQGSLHARRQALSFVKSKEAMTQLFEELAERYKDRQGGYCRIIKLGKNRLGDNSEMAIVQLLGSETDRLSELKSQSGKEKKTKKKESPVLKEVSEEIRTENSSSEKNDESVNPIEAEPTLAEGEEVETKKEISQVENETSKEESPVESVLEPAAKQKPEENIQTETVPEEQLVDADTKKEEPVTTETDSAEDEAKTEPEKEEVQGDSEAVQEETVITSEKVITEEKDPETKTKD
jgi:large subunit ribosomal protein L17